MVIFGGGGAKIIRNSPTSDRKSCEIRFLRFSNFLKENLAIIFFCNNAKRRCKYSIVIYLLQKFPLNAQNFGHSYSRRNEKITKNHVFTGVSRFSRPRLIKFEICASFRHTFVLRAALIYIYKCNCYSIFLSLTTYNQISYCVSMNKLHSPMESWDVFPQP